MEAITLKNVLDGKSNSAGVIYVDENATLLSATQTMCDAQVGAVLVKSSAGEPVGIISERDILRFCAKQHAELDKVAIKEIMTRDLIVGTLDSRVTDAQSIMTEKKFRHMPVVDNGKVVGMISIGDLVRVKLEETDVEVKYLRNYINM